MAEARKLDPEYLKRWGIEAPTDAPELEGNAKVIVKDDFEKKWFGSGKPKKQAPVDTATWRSVLNAGARSTIEGVPVVGPLALGAADIGSAAVRQFTKGEKFNEALDRVRHVGQEDVAAHPVMSVAGGLAGAVAPMAAAVGVPTAARALGMTGTLPQRVAFGGPSNALIGGMDAAVRSGGDPAATATGAGVGGAFGAGAPLVGKGMGSGASWLMRPSNDPITNRLLSIANREGIPIGGAQTTRSPAIHKLSQIAGQFPGSGQRAFQGEQVSEFTRAVARTFGEDTELLTPQVMKAAKRRIGAEFDHVAANTNIKVDQIFQNDLMKIAREAADVLPESEVRPLYNQLTNNAQKIKNGEITGETYQALTRKGTPLDRAMKSSDPNVAYYASGIREALDDGLQRSAPQDLADRLSQARYQYKNMKTVEPLVTKGSPGEVSPLALNQRVNTSFKDRAYSGGGELGDLAEVGQRFFRQPADSGTPMGEFWVNRLMDYGKVAGGAALAGGLGGAAYYGGVEPADIIKGAVGVPASILLARGATSVMNRPQSVNRLMSRAPVVAPYLNQPARNLMLPPPEQPAP